MLYYNLLPDEVEIMDKLIDFKVSAISKLYEDVEANYIKKAEVPYILRYFLQYPSQAELADKIIPEIEKSEKGDSKDKEYVQVDAVKLHVKQIVKENRYPEVDVNVMRQAFYCLDEKRLGYIDFNMLLQFFKNFGNKFRKSELEDFEKFVKTNSAQMFKEETEKTVNVNRSKKFLYEEYLRKVFYESNKHFESLIVEFRYLYKKEIEKKNE